VSGGAIAALIAAGSFVLLVLMLAVPIFKLGRTLDEATIAIRKTHEGAAPLLGDARLTLGQVNGQLDQVEGIARNVNTMTTNAAAMTAIVSTTFGSPMLKVAAFSYGVQRTVQARTHAVVRTERRQRQNARHGRGVR